VFKVTLKDGKSYAFDLAGAHCGQSPTVQLWDRYVRELDARISSCHKIGWYINQVEEKEDKIRVIRASGDTSTIILLDYVDHLKLAQNNVTRCMNAAVDFWVSKSGKSVAVILAGKGDTFREDSSNFVQDVHRTVRHFIEWLKANGQIAVLEGDPDVFEKYLSVQLKETGNENALKGLEIV
jgi:hypothetical protein